MNAHLIRFTMAYIRSLRKETSSNETELYNRNKFSFSWHKCIFTAWLVAWLICYG